MHFIIRPEFITLHANCEEHVMGGRCTSFFFNFAKVLFFVNAISQDIHCVQKKTPTYIFNYNSGISWSIFIFFVPVEREINTLYFTYLQS